MMSLARVSTAALTLFLSVSMVAHAVSDSFIVQTLVGNDSTPPSVPTGLTATPVALTQIDLTWTDSTDDYILSGYQVFRDDIQIATTTTAAYSDTSLLASTTYSYYVTAFDSFNNISASSTIVATTTLAPPPIPPPAPATGGTQYGSKASRLSELTALEIVPSQNGAIVRYETSGYVRSVVKWGKTISYELGSSAEHSFTKSHEILITDLQPGTTYRLTIVGENNVGVYGVLTETSFTTQFADDITPPGNIVRFNAVRRDNDVVLSWENPKDADFDHVRIVRSDIFYPSDTADGWVVYEGDGKAVVDTNILFPKTRIYYTAFAYDRKGNISSGAVVSIAFQGEGTIIDETANDLNIAFRDLEFFQEGVKLAPNPIGSIAINGGSHLTIAIPYERLPEHLKTILVSIVPEADPDKALNFLLRANKDKSFYTARLAPLGTIGNFTVTISIFDFKTAQIGYTKGTLISVISTYNPDTENPDQLPDNARMSIHYIVLFVLLLILLAFTARRLMRSRW